MPTTRPVRVAIVGGGCAGIAAAWHLARLGDRFQVTVYEKDWRLGGKGASGRDEDGRIVEHGLHVWLGFYENAFRMVRDCYGEVQRWDGATRKKKPLTHYSFEDAFVGEPHIGVGIASMPDTRYWSGYFAPTSGTPGDPLDEDTNPFTLSSYMVRCFMLLKALSQSVVGGPGDSSPGGTGGERSMLDEALDRGDKREAPGAVIDALARRIRGGLLAGAGGLEQAFRFLEIWARRLREDTSDRVAPQTLRMLEAVAGQVRKQMGDLVTVDPEIRARMEVIDLVMTIAVGLYRDRVLFSEEGLDAVNHLDYKDWLRKHGATGRVLESQFLNGIYDLAFAFRNGDRTQPSLAAGVALRGALRMFFTYRGAMFWRLRSGMGDAVFAPLFRVLQDLRFTDPALQAEKKVTFRFLHELTDLTVRDAAGVPLVERMAFAASKATKWKKEDEPLDAAGCWSYRKPAVTAKPVRSLARGKDFDAVILAIPIESLRAVMASKKATWITAAKSKAVSPKAAAKAPGAKAAPRPLGDAMPLEWQKALRYLTTAATQSVQVWMREDLESLGWMRGSTIVTAIDAPFQTWADMTHTLPREQAWRARMLKSAVKPSNEARSVAYLCGVVPEDPDPAKRNPAKLASALKTATQVAIEDVFTRVFPAFGTAKIAPSIVAQHFVPNLDPSSRYTLSEPGTVHYRLSPLDRAIANLSVAGDWTACGLDAGCVESAVMSGMLAAYAVSGDEPSPDSIIGYDHP